MACNNPIRRWEINGKVRFTKADQDEYMGFKAEKYSTLIPCGQCMGCRLDYSKEWANRVMLEAETCKGPNYFVTLTYDDAHLPRRTAIKADTGEIKTVSTLVPEDLQKFLKKLRSRWKRHYEVENIRFFGGGEYGEETARAHYHLAIFNLPIFDLKAYKQNPNGDMMYTSAELETVWGNGYVVIGELNWSSAAYIARYMTKKVKGPEGQRVYKDSGIEPPYVRMSRRPGIGQEYYEKHKEHIYEADSLWVPCKGKSKQIKPPKYFDRLYERENQARIEELKASRRRIGLQTEAVKKAQTTLSIEEQGKAREYAQKLSARALKRKL